MKINAQCRNFKFWLSLINRDLHVALINRAGGLYGRILTEVASTNRPVRNAQRCCSAAEWLQEALQNSCKKAGCSSRKFWLFGAAL